MSESTLALLVSVAALQSILEDLETRGAFCFGFDLKTGKEHISVRRNPPGKQCSALCPLRGSNSLFI